MVSLLEYNRLGYVYIPAAATVSASQCETPARHSRVVWSFPLRPVWSEAYGKELQEFRQRHLL